MDKYIAVSILSRFGPATKDILINRVANIIWNRKCNSFPGFLLNERKGFLFPVKITNLQGKYIRRTYAHAESKHHDCYISEFKRR